MLLGGHFLRGEFPRRPARRAGHPGDGRRLGPPRGFRRIVRPRAGGPLLRTSSSGPRQGSAPRPDLARRLRRATSAPASVPSRLTTRQVGRRPARSRRGRGTLGRPAGMRAIVGPGILAEWPAERRITMTRREVREIASDSGSVIGTGSLPSLDPQSTPGPPGPDVILVDGRYRAAEFVRSAVG